jgi:hypothetical protein
MEFALNYSPQAAQLLQEGRIEIDRYKCPDWPDVRVAERPGGDRGGHPASLCPDPFDSIGEG